MTNVMEVLTGVMVVTGPQHVAEADCAQLFGSVWGALEDSNEDDPKEIISLALSISPVVALIR
eukprot:scaffold555505_cov21-Prasinocladus_malaysianus.AAC.1